ncbi:MAG: DNA replication/repair protein RecF [Succinivibrionaceae bacterium]
MFLHDIKIMQFRNIDNKFISFTPNINCILGVNGSGKTSILEAIYYLSVAKSFRTQNNTSIINFNSNEFYVVGNFESDSLKYCIGVNRKNNGNLNIKINRGNITRVSDLASLNFIIPIISKRGDNLVEAQPQTRRAFIDEGCFYNDKFYYSDIVKFTNIIKNRNAILSSKKDLSLLDYWNYEFTNISEIITSKRKNFFQNFYSILLDIIKEILPNFVDSLSIDFFKGYKSDISIDDYLKQIYSKEMIFGYSLVGPHKADFIIKIGNQKANDILSRGQKKALTIIFKLAQGVLYNKIVGKNCIYLIDDISAELDTDTVKRIINYIEKLSMNNQFFITFIPNNYKKDQFLLKHNIIYLS